MPIATNEYIAVQRVVSYSAIATAANTDFDTPTQVVELIPPADNVLGMRLTKAYAINRANPTAVLNCQLYEKVGTTHTLIDSNTMANVTPSATVASVKAAFDMSEEDPLYLAPGVGLAFAISAGVADGVVCRVSGGAYDPEA